MSLKRCAKERLLWAIRQVVLPFGRVVMLVDAYTLRVLSACCTVSELLDEGVDLVELLTKKREPLRGKTALYFISDVTASLDIFLADFEAGKEKYKQAFLMFNCHLFDDSGLRKIAENVDIDRILGCTELHLNFIAYEERVFHGNLGFSLLKLQKYNDDEFLHMVASRLASVCSTLKAIPRIRYQKSDNGFTERLARASQKLISDTSPEGARATDDLLLIVDRSIDAIPLFIHEYTYQAFIYDVLRIPCCSDTADNKADDIWEYEYLASSGKRERRKAILSVESDTLWQRFRHMHIQKVNETVSEEVERITAKVPGYTSNHTNKGEELLNAVRSLPKTQYMIEKYWVHMSLTEKSFELLEEKNILNVGSVEQSLATNIDPKGNRQSHTKMVHNLITLLSDSTVNEETKMRLIMLYISAYRNISEETLEEFYKASGLSSESICSIQQLIEIGIFPVPFEPNNSHKGSVKVLHKHAEKGDAYHYYKKHCDNGEYELSRYMPEIRHIISRAVSGTLEDEKYAFVKKPPSTPDGVVAHTGRTIVYVIGGVSFSEMRIVYEMTDKLKAEVFLGGDSIIVPSQMLDKQAQNWSSKSVRWGE